MAGNILANLILGSSVVSLYFISIGRENIGELCIICQILQKISPSNVVVVVHDDVVI